MGVIFSVIKKIESCRSLYPRTQPYPQFLIKRELQCYVTDAHQRGPQSFVKSADSFDPVDCCKSVEGVFVAIRGMFILSLHENKDDMVVRDMANKLMILSQVESLP